MLSSYGFYIMIDMKTVVFKKIDCNIDISLLASFFLFHGAVTRQRKSSVEILDKNMKYDI